MFIQRTFDLSQPESKKILDAWVALNMPSLLSPSRDSLERFFKKKPIYQTKDSSFRSWNYGRETDSFYIYVLRHCGEWTESSILFVDKARQTENPYELPCVCAQMLDYRDHYYWITDVFVNGGRSKVIALPTPTILPKYPAPRPARLYSDSAKYTYGKVMLDTSGVIIQLLYPYQGKNYVIYAGSADSTFIGELTEHHIEPLQLLWNHALWSGEPVVEQRNGIYQSTFDGRVGIGLGSSRDDVKSVIYVKQDTIMFGYKFVAN